jgi:ADP-ribose pyrophosphatase
VTDRRLPDEPRRPWETLHQEAREGTHGRDLILERVRTHAGEETDYAYLRAPDGVLIVPITDDGRIVMLRQYRHPARAWSWEVPAGTLDDPDEPPETAARRELDEETGGHCADLRPLGRFFGSVAHLTTRNHIFLATGVTLGRKHQESTELARVAVLAPDEAFAMARRGDVADAINALALLLAEVHLTPRPPSP